VPSARRLAQLVVGCVVLGVGVAMLLTADLGSDGYSTMVNGIALASGMSFLLANTLVSIAFLGLAAARKVFPGIGTVVQVVVVGVTVDVLLGAWRVPEDWPARIALLVLAFPVLAVGIATYLGSHTGAGPAEAAALAYDPPLPFRWSYSAVQGGGALLGWLLGATVGVGTLAVIVALGPCVAPAWGVRRLEVPAGGEPDLRPLGCPRPRPARGSIGA
jgi:uncharacterized membrane protein YczE